MPNLKKLDLEIFKYHFEKKMSIIFKEGKKKYFVEKKILTVNLPWSDLCIFLCVIFYKYIFLKYISDLRKRHVKSEVEGNKVKNYFEKFCRNARVELTRTTWPIINTADSPTQVWALLLQRTSYSWDFGDFPKCRFPCWVMELYLPLASFPSRFGPFNRLRCLLYTYLHSTKILLYCETKAGVSLVIEFNL